jgi:hypothetical protein
MIRRPFQAPMLHVVVAVLALAVMLQSAFGAVDHGPQRDVFGNVLCFGMDEDREKPFGHDTLPDCCTLGCLAQPLLPLANAAPYVPGHNGSATALAWPLLQRDAGHAVGHPGCLARGPPVLI